MDSRGTAANDAVDGHRGAAGGAEQDAASGGSHRRRCGNGDAACTAGVDDGEMRRRWARRARGWGADGRAGGRAAAAATLRAGGAARQPRRRRKPPLVPTPTRPPAPQPHPPPPLTTPFQPPPPLEAVLPRAWRRSTATAGRRRTWDARGAPTTPFRRGAGSPAGGRPPSRRPPPAARFGPPLATAPGEVGQSPVAIYRRRSRARAAWCRARRVRRSTEKGAKQKQKTAADGTGSSGLPPGSDALHNFHIYVAPSQWLRPRFGDVAVRPLASALWGTL